MREAIRVDFFGRRKRSARFQKPRKTRVRAQPVRERTVQRDDVGVQLLAGTLELGNAFFPRRGFGAIGDFERFRKLFEHVRLACFFRMQFKAKRAQPDGAQARLHDVQRRLFFGNEKHAPPDCDVVRDDVRDRLRFARARRSVEHKIFPRRRKLHRRDLRGVRIHRTKKFRGIETAPGFLRRERGNAVIENSVPADEMPDNRMRRECIGVAGKVVPHEKFSERKISEPHVFANFPAAQAEHRATENSEHARDVQTRSIAGQRIEPGNFEPMFPPQKFEQRGVDDGVFVAAAQNRTLRGRAAAQAHGHE